MCVCARERERERARERERGRERERERERERCLIYTYDAAEDILCGEHGGLRNIKKNKTNRHIVRDHGEYNIQHTLYHRPTTLRH